MMIQVSFAIGAGNVSIKRHSNRISNLSHKAPSERLSPSMEFKLQLALEFDLAKSKLKLELHT